MKKKILLLGFIIASMAYADDFEDFFENEEGVMLEETVISTTGFEESSKNTMSTVKVITSEEIKEKNYTNVTDVLKSVGTINMSQESALGTLVDIRGQGEDRVRSNVQILLDGVNLNSLESNYGVFPLNSININKVERIEVVQGGGSVIYGSGTSGGVINIITKNNALEDKRVGGYIGMKVGSYGSQSRSVGVTGQLTEDLQLGIDYSGNSSNGYREDSEFSNDNFGADLKYRISEKQNLGLKYSKYENEYSSPDNLTEEELEEDRNGAATDDPAKRDTFKESYAINYDYQINENISLDTLTSYHYNTFVRDESNSRVTKVYNMREDKLAFKPKVNIKYNNGSLVLGYDYVQGEMDRKSSEDTSAKAVKDYVMTKTSNSAFASNSYNISDFQIITGYRYETADFDMKDQINYGVEADDLSKTHSNSSYDAGLNYHFSDSGKVYVKLENGYTIPDPRQYVDLVDSVAEINDLQEETFFTYEIGYQNYVGNTLVKAALFSTEKEDEIRSESKKTKSGKTTLYNITYFNLEETKRSGGELSFTHNFNKLTVTESLAYVNAEITAGDYEGKKIPYVSPLTAGIDAVYDINEKADFGVNISYKDKYYVDKDNEGGEVNDIFTTNINSNYYVADDLKVYAGINNLFNYEYNNKVSYDSDEETYSYDPAAETNYYVGFNLNF